MARTRDFALVLQSRIKSDPELAQLVEEESFNADIAQQVHDLRTEAGLTQAQLAKRIGTQQSVISRIEDADYDGHSLTMLRRIANALGRRIRIDFCALPRPVEATSPSLNAFSSAIVSTEGHVPRRFDSKYTITTKTSTSSVVQ